MQIRKWLIEIDATTEGCEVRFLVDGTELLPRLEDASLVDALACIEELLGDFREGDIIAIVARQHSTIVSTCTTGLRFVAIEWCAGMLPAVWYQNSEQLGSHLHVDSCEPTSGAGPRGV